MQKVKQGPKQRARTSPGSKLTAPKPSQKSASTSSTKNTSMFFKNLLKVQSLITSLFRKKGELVDSSNKTILQIIYTPDFVSYEHKFIIETKGYVMSDDFPLRWKMFLKHCRETRCTTGNSLSRRIKAK
jgi:hypothetical protein